MAEAEVTIQYREAPVAFLSKAFVVAIPLMGIFAVWSFVVLLSASMARGSAITIIMMAEVLILGVMILFAILSSDQTIFITRDGMSFPWMLCPSFATRTNKPWRALKGVQFSDAYNIATLKLVFENGSSVILNLNKLQSDQVEDLIVAIDVWGGGNDSFPALLQARSYVRGGEVLELATSHTEMWEDELARRFGATNFIPLEPGDKVKSGEFTVVRQVAFGGMSAIYLIENANRESFILKESVVPDDSDERLRTQASDMLAKEARMLAALSHPQIAAIKDHFVEGSRHYLLLEHLKGQDLRRLVKEFGPQKQEDVVHWSRQIADILSYLHHRDVPVIHRDLTPDNLVLQESGEIALIDFGAANLYIGTATGTIIGKQAYIAPEQLRGKATVQSDIYSFGGTIHYLLTGEDPEPLAVSHPASKRNGISPALDSLVADCTAMEVEDRVQSVDDVMRRLTENGGAAV